MKKSMIIILIGILFINLVIATDFEYLLINEDLTATFDSEIEGTIRIYEFSEYLKEDEVWSGIGEGRKEQNTVTDSVNCKYGLDFSGECILNYCVEEKDSVDFTSNGCVEGSKEIRETYLSPGDEPSSLLKLETLNVAAIDFGDECGDLYKLKESSCGGHKFFRYEFSDCRNEENTISFNGHLETIKEPLSMQVYVNPGMIKDFTKPLSDGGRGFKPGITPFSDIICEAKALICGKVTEKLANAEARLIVIDEIGNEVAELKKGKMLYSGPEVINGEAVWDIYKWEIDGWGDGWSDDNEAMEKLIETGQARCEIDLGEEDLPKLEHDFSAGICVQIWGEDTTKFKFASLRGGSSALTPKEIMDLGIENTEYGFHRVDPFKTYKKDFTHFVDLKKIDESGYFFSVPEGYYTSIVDYIIPGDSSCLDKNIRLNLFYTRNGMPVGQGGYTRKFSPTIYLYPELNPITADLGYTLPLVAVHESGHAFCGLSDEYILYDISHNFFSDISHIYPNCELIGLFFHPWGETDHIGCQFKDAYRPSYKSIMNSRDFRTGENLWDRRFNTYSCGYCVNIIKNIFMEDSWRTCNKPLMDTIKPRP